MTEHVLHGNLAYTLMNESWVKPFPDSIYDLSRAISIFNFPSPVEHILSELSTMTCPFWVALHSMAHSFIELDRTTVYRFAKHPTQLK